ncbi:MAG: hypothetical protein IRY97_06935 [Thermomicrobiaceae bacterium]|nr:hypothetical protein [Thermomicrobiaceae bacterium]
MSSSSRDVGVHLYLSQCVVLGSIYVSVERVVDHFNLAGRHIHVHRPMRIPFREGTSPVHASEAVVNRADVLFAVHRPDGASGGAEPAESAAWHEVEVVLGPFTIRGRIDLGPKGTLHHLLMAEEQFLPLADARIDGPLGATFTEPSVILNKERIEFVSI